MDHILRPDLRKKREECGVSQTWEVTTATHGLWKLRGCDPSIQAILSPMSTRSSNRITYHGECVLLMWIEVREIATTAAQWDFFWTWWHKNPTSNSNGYLKNLGGGSVRVIHVWHSIGRRRAYHNTCSVSDFPPTVRQQIVLTNLLSTAGAEDEDDNDEECANIYVLIESD